MVYCCPNYYSCEGNINVQYIVGWYIYQSLIVQALNKDSDGFYKLKPWMKVIGYAVTPSPNLKFLCVHSKVIYHKETSDAWRHSSISNMYA
jgi:hypothetical protein